jgi:dihydropyrimidinase
MDGSRFDLIVRGGTVVNADGPFKADIGIRAGTIASLTTPGTIGNAERVISAEGLYVVPGGVDAHAHTALRSRETTSLDDFFESTRAAAYGGTTTIVDFAVPFPRGAQTPVEAAASRADEIQGRACVDVALHAGATVVNENTLKELAELITRRGMPTVKIFTIYRDDLMLTLDEIFACLKTIAACDGIAMIHAESPHIVEPLAADLTAKGDTSPAAHARSRPNESEIDMVQSIIELLRLTGARAWIAHVSTPEAAIAIAQAQGRGVGVWSETCPQYVFLDNSRYLGGNPELYVCSPPLRDKADRERLWELVARGYISMWASDHCCFDRQQKAAHREDFHRIPNGLPGVETRCPLLFSEGVSKGKITIADFVRMSSSNPAKFNGLFPAKGLIAPGSDADLAIWDPTVTRTLTAAGLHQGTDFTPFEGFRIAGWPRTVISRGKLIVDEGEFVGAPGYGKLLAAGQPLSMGAGRR